MATADFQRARSAEAKRIRETAILNAARDLATEHGVRAVTLTDIAATVGMHKSAVLRYFETREQLFLLLTAEGWQDWSPALREQLAQLPSRRNDPGATRERAPVVARLVSKSLITRPLFCDLLAQTPLNLERNVSVESLRSFKLAALTESGAVATALLRVLPLRPQQARNVVVTATSMAGALWQMAAPGSHLREIYQSDPQLRHAIVDVGPRLAGILTGLIVGYAAGL